MGTLYVNSSYEQVAGMLQFVRIIFETAFIQVFA